MFTNTGGAITPVIMLTNGASPRYVQRAQAFYPQTTLSGISPQWQNCYFQKKLDVNIGDEYWLMLEMPPVGWYYTPSLVNAGPFVSPYVQVNQSTSAAPTQSRVNNTTGMGTTRTYANGDLYGIDVLMLVPGVS